MHGVKLIAAALAVAVALGLASVGAPRVDEKVEAGLIGNINADELALIDKIVIYYSPYMIQGVGSNSLLTLTIKEGECSALAEQLTFYCNAEDGSELSEIATRFEQTAALRPGVYEGFRAKTIEGLIAHNGALVYSQPYDGHNVQLSLFAGDYLYAVSGVMADVVGPPWFAALCETMKEIMRDAGIDMDEALGVSGY